MPRLLLYYKLRTLVIISLIWLLLGFIYYINLIKPSNDLGVRVSLLQFSIAFGIIGLLISAVLIFYLKSAFNHLPLWLSIVIKLIITLMLFFVIAFVLLMVYYLIHYKGTLEHYLHSFFTKLAYTYTFLSFIIDMGFTTMLTIILLEVTDKYGPGMFWSMLRGQYHKPKIENRIFVFLDMNDSTTLAELLGHEKYFRMLRDFYNDITKTILANDGQIYQYVGDEIVVNWLNTPENKLKALKFIRNTFYLIERFRKRYERRYGKVPTFKAGIHAGEVTAGFVGLIKKDLIYCGDTMNTAARIRSMCTELNESFILSEDFVHDFYQPFGYEISNIGKIELKGRLEPVKLFSLKFQ